MTCRACDNECYLPDPKRPKHCPDGEVDEEAEGWGCELEALLPAPTGDLQDICASVPPSAPQPPMSNQPPSAPGLPMGWGCVTPWGYDEKGNCADRWTKFNSCKRVPGGQFPSLSHCVAQCSEWDNPGLPPLPDDDLPPEPEGPDPPAPPAPQPPSAPPCRPRPMLQS